MPQQIYTVRDSKTGRTVTFRWDGTEPPTDQDMEDVFAEAAATDPQIKMEDIARQASAPPTQAPGMLESLGPTALRAGLPTAGAILGGFAGPAAPVAVPLLGAAGGTLGDYIAQKTEQLTGTRGEYNPYLTAVETGLGALGPIKGLRPGTSIAGAIARRAPWGVALGGGGYVATELAEGRQPELGTGLATAGLGAAIGTLGGLGERALANRAVRLASERLDAGGGPDLPILPPDVPPVPPRPSGPGLSEALQQLQREVEEDAAKRAAVKAAQEIRPEAPSAARLTPEEADALKQARIGRGSRVMDEDIQDIVKSRSPEELQSDIAIIESTLASKSPDDVERSVRYLKAAQDELATRQKSVAPPAEQPPSAEAPVAEALQQPTTRIFKDVQAGDQRTKLMTPEEMAARGITERRADELAKKFGGTQAPKPPTEPPILEGPKYEPGDLVRHEKYGVTRVAVTDEYLETMSIQELERYRHKVVSHPNPTDPVSDELILKKIDEEFANRLGGGLSKVGLTPPTEPPADIDRAIEELTNRFRKGFRGTQPPEPPTEPGLAGLPPPGTLPFKPKQSGKFLTSFGEKIKDFERRFFENTKAIAAAVREVNNITSDALRKSKAEEIQKLVDSSARQLNKLDDMGVDTSVQARWLMDAVSGRDPVDLRPKADVTPLRPRGPAGGPPTPPTPPTEPPAAGPKPPAPPPSKGGPPSGEAGFIHPVIPTKLGAATAGALIGGFVDPSREEGGPLSLRGVTIGALAGYGGAAALAKAAARRPGTKVPGFPELDKLQELRKAGAAQPTLAARAKDVFHGHVERVWDQLIRPKSAVKGVLKSLPAGTVPTGKNPIAVMEAVVGGVGGPMERMAVLYTDIANRARDLDLDDAVTKYLDLKGFAHGLETLTQKGLAAIRAGQPRRAARYLTKIQAGRAVPGGYTPQTVAADLQRFEQTLGPNKFAAVRNMGEQVFALNRVAWDTIRQAGLVSDNVYNAILRRHNDYIPLDRISDVFEGLSGQGVSKLNVRYQTVLKSLEGSVKPTEDPIGASIIRHTRAIKEAARNYSVKTFIEFFTTHAPTADVVGRELKPRLIKGAWSTPPARQGFDTISFFDNGRKRTFEVEQKIANALNFAHEKGINASMGVIMKVHGIIHSTAMRAATAANLTFSVPNVARDVGAARSMSIAFKTWNPKDAVKTSGEWVKAVGEVLNKSPLYLEFLGSGAAYSTLQKHISPETFKPGQEGWLINDIEKFNNALEEATKVTTYTRLRKEGAVNPIPGFVGDLDAALETRKFGGSPDFAVRGTSELVRNMFLFFSPQLAGVRQTVTGFKRMSNRKKMLYLMATTAGAFSAQAWNSQFRNPDDGTPELLHVSKTDKDNNYILFWPDWMKGAIYKTQDGALRRQYFKIPKAHIDKALFNPIAGLMENMAYGSDAITLPQIVADLASALAPGSVGLESDALVSSTARNAISALTPAVRVPVEAFFSNWDYFRNRPIEARRFEDVDPEFRYTSRTSPAAIWAANQLAKVTRDVPLLKEIASPEKLDYMVRTFFSAPGEVTVDLLGAIFGGKTGREATSEQITLTERPVAGPMARRFLGSPTDEVERKQFERFYDAFEKGERGKRTFNDRAKRDPKGVREWLKDEDNLKRIILSEATKGLALEFTTLNKALEMLRTPKATPHISIQERNNSIRRIKLARARVLMDSDRLLDRIEKQNLQEIIAKMP